jgi:hypothetical protein
MAQLIALRRKPDTPANASADPDECCSAIRERLQAEHKRETDLLLGAIVKELGLECPPTVDRPGELVESVCRPVFWREITFTVCNEHTVEIATRQSRRNFSYEDLQLCDRRDGTPDSRWQMLLRLAGHDGVLKRPPLSLGHRDDGWWSTWKKDIQGLRKWLRGRFQIAGDPLPFSEGGYSAQFGIGLRGSYREELRYAAKQRE